MPPETARQGRGDHDRGALAAPCASPERRGEPHLSSGSPLGRWILVGQLACDLEAEWCVAGHEGPEMAFPYECLEMEFPYGCLWLWCSRGAASASGPMAQKNRPRCAGLVGVGLHPSSAEERTKGARAPESGHSSPPLTGAVGGLRGLHATRSGRSAEA